MAYRDRKVAADAKAMMKILDNAYKRGQQDDCADNDEMVAIRMKDEEFQIYQTYLASHKAEVDDRVAVPKVDTYKGDDRIETFWETRESRFRMAAFEGVHWKEVREVAHAAMQRYPLKTEEERAADVRDRGYSK
jgi:hypothetical protein